MNYESFEAEFLKELRGKNKKCLNILNENKKLIEEYLGEKGNPKTVHHMVENINDIIISETKEKNYSLYEKVLKHEAFTNVYSVFKDSNILVKACQNENKPLAKWLITTMDINTCVQDDEGMSALMYAVKNGKFNSVIKLLIKKEECVNLVDKNGDNVIYHSLQNTDNLFELMNSLVLDVNHVSQRTKETYLLTLCKEERYKPFKFLIKNGNIDVNATDKLGKTVAMYLIERGRYSELTYLSNKNCNFDYFNEDNESAISILIKKMYRSVENYNGGRNAEEEMNKNFQCFIELIKMGYNFSGPMDKDGNTALMAFLLLQDEASLGFIFTYAKNLDLSVKNNYGESASSLLIKLKDNRMCRNIVNIESTFDFDYIDKNNNNTMLMLASITQPFLVYKMAENDVNLVNNVNTKNENALIIATKAGNLYSVEYLLKCSININQQDILGNTALHYAVSLKNKAIIEKLIMSKADIDIKNNEKKSPLNLAHELEDKEILNILTNPSLLNSESSSSSNNNKGKKEEDNENEKQLYKYNEVKEYLYPCVGELNEFCNSVLLTKEKENLIKIFFVKLMFKERGVYGTEIYEEKSINSKTYINDLIEILMKDLPTKYKNSIPVLF